MTNFVPWILSSSVLIVCVLALRRMLRGHASARLRYALWLLVLVRLLLPVQLGQTALSVQNAVPTRAPEPTVQSTPAPQIQAVPPDAIQHALPAAAEPTPPIPSAAPAAPEKTPSGPSLQHVLRLVWLGGMAVLALCILAANAHFWLQLCRTRSRLPLPGRVYTAAVPTPCLFGLVRPAIYLPPAVAQDETALRHALVHERTHLRHGDALWSLLRCVCLVLHWYNPLVWCAAFFSQRDAELACDEAAVRTLGEQERAAYGRTLLRLTCSGRPALLRTATTMSGGKSQIKERIEMLVKKPKTALLTLLAVLLIAALTVGCTFTGAKQDASTSPREPILEEPQSPEPEEAPDIPEELPEPEQTPAPEETPEPEEAAPQGSLIAGNLSDLTPVLNALPDTQVLITLVLDSGEGNMVIAGYDASDTPNDPSDSLTGFAYEPVEPSELETTGRMLYVCGMDEASDWQLTFYEGSHDLLLSFGGGTPQCFRCTYGEESGQCVGDIVRMWFNEAQYRDMGGFYEDQDQIVIPDEGQDYLAAAQAFCDAFEGKHLDATSGSQFCYTYVACTVSPAEEETAVRRERGDLGENMWAFTLRTDFVPENERALSWSMAGNTGSCPDPDAPEGAYSYSRCGYITRSEDGWHCELVGTGW